MPHFCLSIYDFLVDTRRQKVKVNLSVYIDNNTAENMTKLSACYKSDIAWNKFQVLNLFIELKKYL